MTLILLLLIPLLGAAVVMACKSRRPAAAVALVTGAVELAAIGNAVWKIHVGGSLQTGRYLRADGLTSFFLINIGLIFALVLAY